MYCRDCSGLEPHRDADGLTSHRCRYTGVAVTTLVLCADADEHDNASPHEADDHQAMCPRNLAKMMHSKVGQGLVRGVLRQVQERGELDALMAEYPAATADRLQQILLEGSGASLGSPARWHRTRCGKPGRHGGGGRRRVTSLPGAGSSPASPASICGRPCTNRVTIMRKQPYQGCNCRQCAWGSGRDWKQASHRAYRRAERLAMRRGDEPPECIKQPWWRA